MREKILEGAHTLFVQYGVRSVSMDDVARALSVSKKTLYQHFANKDELVTETVRLHIAKEENEFDQIKSSSQDAIEELFMLSKCMREHVLKLNPSLMFDLQKYHADAWEIFLQFKHKFLMGQITHNLERGIKEGYFRKEINPQVLGKFRVESVQLIFSEQIFPRAEFNFVDVQLQVFDHFVHGILAEEGRKLYQNYLQLETNNHSN